jgi:D-alanyl-D-alanine endopeptidase (penicillin-binding protein 7)
MRSLNWGLHLVALATSSIFLATFVSHPASATNANGTRPSTATSRTATASPAIPKTPRPTPAKPSTLRLDRPEVRSNSALVFDETNATILYAKRADVALPIASITKLMTALVVLESKQPLDEVIQITRDDRDSERNSYSRLAVGTKLQRRDLLQLALMSSENRAAHALGRNYAGGMPGFIRAMNAKAKMLGMTKTRFVDPTGLSSKNVASPADLSKLVIAAADHPAIRQFSTKDEYAVAVGRQVLTFRNTNTLVMNPTWNILVQKTGYISEAGQCLVLKAMIEGRAIVIVLLDSFGKYTRVADAKRIRTWMEATQNISRKVANGEAR